MQDKSFVSAIIVAAGNSSRMNGVDKQFRPIAGVPVLARSILAFERAEKIDEIIVVTRPESIAVVESLVRQYAFTKVKAIVTGGETRSASVLRGIQATDPNSDYVAIHDGARPLVAPEDIDRCVLDAWRYKASFLGVRVKDTVKQVRRLCHFYAGSGAALHRPDPPGLPKGDVSFRAGKG